jgi:hypothetical protein
MFGWLMIITTIIMVKIITITTSITIIALIPLGMNLTYTQKDWASNPSQTQTSPTFRRPFETQQLSD